MTTQPDVKALLQPHLEKGLELWMEGDALRFKAPKEMLTKDLMGVLKANKQGIIDWLQSENASEEPAQATMVDEYPLAYTQGAIWMLYKFAPASPAYNTTFACTLSQRVEESAVRQAFHALLVRHPVLRSTYADTDSGPVQRVWSHMSMPLQLVDASGWNEQQLQQQLDQEADAPFDLQQQACLRVKLFQNSVKGDILMATIHHVGADLWALLIIAQDIKNFYQTASSGEALAVDPVAVLYRDHVRLQQEFMESDRGQLERDYWRHQLQSAPLALSLPSDFERPPVLQLQTEVVQQHIAQQTYTDIKTFCKNNSITPFVFVQSAYQLMVYQMTGADDFLVGTPTMGRARKGMDQVVGDFANPVVLRAGLEPDSGIKTLFSGVKQTLLEAMEHQECPFPVVVQDSNPPRDSSRTPLFQLIFVWHQGSPEMMPKDGFIKDVLPMSGPRGAPYDVMLAVSDTGDHFEFNWTYQTSMYKRQTVEQFGLIVQRYMAAFLNGDQQRAVTELVNTVTADTPMDQLPLTADTFLVSDEAVRSQAIECAPCLHNLEFVVVEPVAGRSSLMVAAAQQQLQPFMANLKAQFNDVVCVPYLPKHANGQLDVNQLKKLPQLDQKQLTDKLASEGVSDQDTVVLHQSYLKPTFTQHNMDANGSASKSSRPKSVEVSQRPDAWMVNDTALSAENTATHLFEALEGTAERFPDRGFLFVDGQGSEHLYRYSQLVSDARKVSAAMAQCDLAATDILLLQMQFDWRFFAVWWGAVHRGVRPLVVATPEQYSERNGVAQKLYNVAHNFPHLMVAADENRVEQTQSWLGESKKVISAQRLLDTVLSGAAVDVEQAYARNEDGVAFLQLTSGSTGTPKAIQITHHGVLHQVTASAEFNGYGSDDISLNWLPFDHVVPILTTHLKDVVLGIQQVQIPTAAILSQPLLWLKMMSDYRVTYSWAPNFAYQRVIDALNTENQFDQFDLSCVKTLLNAGEQVLAPVVRAFTAALQPYGLHADAVQPSFGMAEACTCMTFNNESSELLSVHYRTTDDANILDVVPAQQSEHSFVDLGATMPGVEVRITDSNNQLVKEGVIGRMQLRGPVITPGYLNNPDANAEAFVGDGWFNSGDLGFIWNKRLSITGREKEMIVINGANYYCFELEQVVANLDGVLPTFVAATGVVEASGNGTEQLVLFYVVDGEMEESDQTALERQIIARVSEAFGVVALYALAVEQEGFFKTTSGKIQRGQFKKLFESGEFSQQVQDFKARHNEKEALPDTAFAYQWLTTSHRSQQTEEPASAEFDLSQLPSNEKGGIESQPQLTEELAQFFLTCQQDATLPLINMGYWHSGSDATPSSLAQQGFGLTQKFALLAQAQGQSNLPVVLWIQAEQKHALMELKPLVETLRQETGNQQIVCVVSPKQEKPQLAQLSLPALEADGALTGPAIVWQQKGLQQRLAISAVAANGLPNRLVASNGLYLITGGLGGLAEPVCEYLVGNNAKVILSGRSELSTDAKRQSRFNQLQSRFGKDRISYLCLTDWNQETLVSSINGAVTTIGNKQLDGIFHLAGTMEMQSLSDFDGDHWNRLVDAKVNGSYALADYLQQHSPRGKLIQYGSLNGYFGGQAAAGYSLVNALQSKLTSYLNQTSSIKSWCLNWSVWQEAGMAAQFSVADIQMARNKGFIPLQVQRDSHLIAGLLQLPPSNYFAGLDSSNPNLQSQLDWFNRSGHIIQVHVDGSEGKAQPSTPQLAQMVSCKQPLVNDPTIEFHLSSQPFQRNDDDQIIIESLVVGAAEQGDSGVAPQNQVEQDIAEIWTQILGRPVNDTSRSFFEYGGHSINATQVVEAMNNKLGMPVTVAQLFQYPTIGELASACADQATSDQLSLTLQDCLQRADSVRIDRVNPSTESDIGFVFLPTALGVSNVYGQMISEFQQNAACYVVSAPTNEVNDTSLATTATKVIGLLEEEKLLNHKLVLIGWSIGGVLGYEVLRQLDQKGTPLPQLIMLDSGINDGLNPLTFDEAFQHLMFATELGLAAGQIAEFNQQLQLNKKLQWMQQYLATIGIEVTVAILLEWWETYAGRLQSLLTYKVQAPLTQANISQIEAAHQTHGRDDLGWRDQKNIISWHRADADHQGVVKSAEAFDCIRGLVPK